MYFFYLKLKLCAYERKWYMSIMYCVWFKREDHVISMWEFQAGEGEIDIRSVVPMSLQVSKVVFCTKDIPSLICAQLVAIREKKRTKKIGIVLLLILRPHNYLVCDFPSLRYIHTDSSSTFYKNLQKPREKLLIVLLLLFSSSKDIIRSVKSSAFVCFDILLCFHILANGNTPVKQFFLGNPHNLPTYMNNNNNKQK